MSPEVGVATRVTSLMSPGDKQALRHLYKYTQVMPENGTLDGELFPSMVPLIQRVLKAYGAYPTPSKWQPTIASFLLRGYVDAPSMRTVIEQEFGGWLFDHCQNMVFLKDVMVAFEDYIRRTKSEEPPQQLALYAQALTEFTLESSKIQLVLTVFGVRGRSDENGEPYDE